MPCAERGKEAGGDLRGEIWGKFDSHRDRLHSEMPTMLGLRGLVSVDQSTGPSHVQALCVPPLGGLASFGSVSISQSALSGVRPAQTNYGRVVTTPALCGPRHTKAHTQSHTLPQIPQSASSFEK